MDIKLWESETIMKYLIDIYEENRMSLPTLLKECHLKRFLHLQMSGPGL